MRQKPEFSRGESVGGGGELSSMPLSAVLVSTCKGIKQVLMGGYLGLVKKNQAA